MDIFSFLPPPPFLRPISSLVGRKKSGHNADRKNPEYEDNQPETGLSSP
jgi:hypothetical protein